MTAAQATVHFTRIGITLVGSMSEIKSLFPTESSFPVDGKLFSISEYARTVASLCVSAMFQDPAVQMGAMWPHLKLRPMCTSRSQPYFKRPYSLAALFGDDAVEDADVGMLDPPMFTTELSQALEYFAAEDVDLPWLDTADERLWVRDFGEYTRRAAMRKAKLCAYACVNGVMVEHNLERVWDLDETRDILMKTAYIMPGNIHVCASDAGEYEVTLVGFPVKRLTAT